MARRSAVLAAAVAAATLLLSACASLPSTGPVRAGREVPAGVDPLRVLPEGPRPGADPQAVVHGFLRAGAGLEEDYSIARSFLTTRARSAWRPGRGVVVYGEDARLSLTVSGTTVTARTEVVGRIAADGHYVEALPGTTASARFGVEQVEGQWRVASVPEDFGTWLPRYDVERVYTPARIYFATGTRGALVPDVRWLPARVGLATALARAVLAGPPAYLTGAVAASAPPGTRLGVDAVPVSEGRAVVELTAEALEATAERRLALWAQMTATLRQGPSGVTSVVLAVDGVPYDVPGGVAVLGRDPRAAGFVTEPAADGRPVVAGSGRLVRLSAGGGGPDGDVAVVESVPMGLRSLTVSGDSTTWAGAVGDDVVVLRPGDQPATVARRPGLLSVSWGPAGWLWWAGSDGTLRALSTEPSTDGRQPQLVSVDAAWLRGREVRSVQVSRDGSRLAVVSAGRDGRGRVDVTGIQRDPAGVPLRLTGRVTCAVLVHDARSVAWAGATDLAVLGRPQAGAPPQPYLAGVGGVTTALPPVSGAVEVAAGVGARRVYVVTSAGDVLARSGAGWERVARGTSVVVPGR